MINEMIEIPVDVVVIGGGMSGVCAAIASARQGAKTALIQNRPVLGGNASSEIRMHICGADCHGARKNSRESGILEEILLCNRSCNPNHSFSVFDTVLWEKTRYQDNLALFLNTHMTCAEKDGRKITAIYAEQLTTSKQFCFRASCFIDATGDANLSWLAGATCMAGREGQDIYGESLAPSETDSIVMGSSLMFQAVDTGKTVVFKKPVWANSYTEKDLDGKGRGHAKPFSGYWWMELGGDELDPLADAETIRDELLKVVYGVWDHIKNDVGSEHDAENYALDWVGFLPGKRESRRVKGEYVLTQNDLVENRHYADAVAFGGWPIDLHPAGGMKSPDEPARQIMLRDNYQIPYRCLIAENIDNLLLAGRIISASHVAFSSTRVMGTCAVVGQAAGTAAALAVRNHRDIRHFVNEPETLQQVLLANDCYIPDLINNQHGDLAKDAKVSCSSETSAGKADHVINGMMRSIREDSNCWISEEMQPDGEWIKLTFASLETIAQVRIIFDSNLSRDIMPTISQFARARQIDGMPAELVKAYDLSLLDHDHEVYRTMENENVYRMAVIDIPKQTRCDSILLRIRQTYGDRHARVFEISACS